MNNTRAVNEGYSTGELQEPGADHHYAFPARNTTYPRYHWAQAVDRYANKSNSVLSQQHLDRIWKTRKIVVFMCFLFLLLAIGLPKWGQCITSSTSWGHFGVFQGTFTAAGETKTCVLDLDDESFKGLPEKYNNLKSTFDAGRVMTVASVLLFFPLLQKFRTNWSAAIATACVTVYFLTTTILMSTVVHDDDIALVVLELGHCFHSSSDDDNYDDDDDYSGERGCSGDASYSLYAAVLGLLFCMSAVLCWYSLYESYYYPSEEPFNDPRKALLRQGPQASSPMIPHGAGYYVDNTGQRFPSQLPAYGMSGYAGVYQQPMYPNQPANSMEPPRTVETGTQVAASIDNS